MAEPKGLRREYFCQDESRARDKCRHGGAVACRLCLRGYAWGMKGFVLSALLSVGLSGVPFGAAAEVRALLVGVSDYLVLDADLKGPSQDVALMAEALTARSVPAGAIVALASEDAGLPAGVYAGVPRRAAILAAMAEVAAAAQPGDTVFFYFSGHGGQAPDLNGDEGGGPDEILLPADAAGWKGAIGAVENALVDDELQLWAQGLLARGVQVVGVLDACHAATGFRALGGAGAARGLTAAELGVPDGADGAAGDLAAAGPDDGLSGAFAFLYAAQSDQRAFEYPVGDSGLWHGAFTLQLAQVLRDAPQASWAQVLAATSAQMMQGAVRQDPEGEGPLLDAQVFGTGGGQARIVVADGVLRAGALDGLAVGDTVAFYAQAAGGQPLGQALLAQVEARSATVAEGDAFPRALWAERVAPAAPAALRLASAVRADPADGFDYGDWETALAARDGGPATDPAGADLVPILTGGQLALAGADGALDPAGPDSSPRVSLRDGETAPDALERVLAQAGHALRLRALLGRVSGRSLTGQAALSVHYTRRSGTPQGADCAAPAPELVPVDPAGGLRGCDELWLRFRNDAAEAMDVSVLYFDKDFNVIPLWPRNGLSNRLQPAEGARAGLRIDADGAAGVGEILMLAVPVVPGAARVDLTQLADTGQDTGQDGGQDRAQTRGPNGPEGAWFAQMLDEDAPTRGFSLRPPALNLLRQPVRVLAQGQEIGR